VVILAHTSVAEGAAFAERFLARVRELRPEGIDVSMSLGIASLGGLGDQSGEALLANADAAGYRAKRLGGNRACVFDPDLDLAVPPEQKPDAASALVATDELSALSRTPNPNAQSHLCDVALPLASPG
jgi:predicted signal transduction protein with EAL and GGDEF domain